MLSMNNITRLLIQGVRLRDQLGLLRYMEVGGGEEFAHGPTDGFCARYMTEKLLRMFRVRVPASAVTIIPLIIAAFQHGWRGFFTMAWCGRYFMTLRGVLRAGWRSFVTPERADAPLD